MIQKKGVYLVKMVIF